MIPTFDVAPGCNINFRALRDPGLALREANVAFNGDHFSLTTTTWARAQEALHLERDWLRAADAASSSRREYEDALYELEDDDPETAAIASWASTSESPA